MKRFLINAQFIIPSGLKIFLQLWRQTRFPFQVLAPIFIEAAGFPLQSLPLIHNTKRLHVYEH
jgi:hypothetical protein